MITSLRDSDVRSARSTLASTMKSVNDKRKSVKGAGDSNLSARLDIAAMELLNLNESLQHQSMEFSSKLMTQSFATGSRGR
jgi:hypothetical protein